MRTGAIDAYPDYTGTVREEILRETEATTVPQVRAALALGVQELFLNLNDHATILQGAVPAAVLALGVQELFEGLDRWVIPRGLRLETGRRP